MISVACACCGKDFTKPNTNPPTNTKFCSLECRFWSKVDKSAGPDGCWPWMGARTAAGYGSFGLDGGIERAHRISYRLAHGHIADGFCVCHKCDNPACCNPSHYFLGTHQDNMVDMHAKGRNKMTPDGLERLKASKRGKPRPADVREKLSAALRGRRMPGEVVQKIAEANRGGKRSDETKAKMRAAWERRRVQSPSGTGHSY